MNKLVVMSALFVGLVGLQACDKAEKPKEEQAATLGLFEDIEKAGSNVMHQVEHTAQAVGKVGKKVVDSPVTQGAAIGAVKGGLTMGFGGAVVGAGMGVGEALEKQNK